MFWGLILEAGKRYSQKVVKSFHVSMATLEIQPHTDNENVPVMLEYEDGREYLLCNLNKTRNMQCALDLNFKVGERIGFYSASGKSRVHMTGYLVEELEDLDSSADEEEEEVDEAEEEEVKSASNPMKRKEVTGDQSGKKKQKLIEADEESDEDDDDDDEEDDDDDEDEEEEEEEDSDNLISAVKKKEKDIKPKLNQSTPNEKLKKKEALGQSQDKTPREQNGQVNTPQSKSSKKNKQAETTLPSTPTSTKELQGGVSISDKVVGGGAVARPGNKVTVYYVGRLKANNKQFDSCTNGPGFKFSLGRGEVIRGWDVGISGMRVGGKRTISVPPGMGYGKRGQPPVIPPHSTLVFDVELKNVM